MFLSQQPQVLLASLLGSLLNFWAAMWLEVLDLMKRYVSTELLKSLGGLSNSSARKSLINSCSMFCG